MGFVFSLTPHRRLDGAKIVPVSTRTDISIRVNRHTFYVLSEPGGRRITAEAVTAEHHPP